MAQWHRAGGAGGEQRASGEHARATADEQAPLPPRLRRPRRIDRAFIHHHTRMDDDASQTSSVDDAPAVIIDCGATETRCGWAGDGQALRDPRSASIGWPFPGVKMVYDALETEASDQPLVLTEKPGTSSYSRESLAHGFFALGVRRFIYGATNHGALSRRH